MKHVLEPNLNSSSTHRANLPSRSVSESRDLRDVVLGCIRKHFSITGTFQHYPGIVSLHALTRLAVPGADREALAEARAYLLPFARGEMDFSCNFPNYQCGGNAAAWLLFKGHLPEAKDAVRRYAEITITESPRTSEGLFTHPKFAGEDRIFIDAAFAVCPFLLFAGLALGEERYVAEAWTQARGMIGILQNPDTGLLHQCRGFRAPGILSEDHWSRGNGWGVYALTELACHLPDPSKQDAVALLRELLSACLAFQNPTRHLWHQEMTETKYSYIEISGSALILYAMGVGLSEGFLDHTFRAPFENGIHAILDYVTNECDIFNVCAGCLCPGEGRKINYMATPPVRNDCHGFGSVALAMSQARLLGYPFSLKTPNP